LSCGWLWRCCGSSRCSLCSVCSNGYGEGSTARRSARSPHPRAARAVGGQRAVLHGARHLSLFLLFLQEIISRRHLLLRGNAGPPTVWRTQEQRRRPLFFRCSRCFDWKNSGTAKGITAGDKFIAPSDRFCIPATITQQPVCCQFDKCLIRTTWVAIAGRHCGQHPSRTALCYLRN
jgi:hypothetical protein